MSRIRLRIAPAILAVASIVLCGQTDSAGLDFTFSVTNTGGNVAGTFTGEIFGLTNNGTSKATSVIITSFPSSLKSLVGAPVVATLWNQQDENSFTVTNGKITAGGFWAEQTISGYNAGYQLYVDGSGGPYNFLNLDGTDSHFVWGNDGLAAANLALVGQLSGPLLQNSSPVDVPTTADFLVVGPVTTGGPNENNTVNTLTFTPGSSLTIFNTLFVTQGPVTLVGGSSIFLDGNLSTSQLDVLFGGLLNGAGTIFGNLFNSGKVTPGDAPGTITITGNFAQDSTGTLSILLAGGKHPSHSLLQVLGQADLGGTLQLVSQDGFILQPGKKITILTASQGIIGRFATVSDPFPKDTIIDPTVVYSGSRIVLETQSFSQFASSRGLSPNEKSVATALDSVVHDGRASSLVAYLDYRHLSDLPSDFDRIAPEGLTSMLTLGPAFELVQSLNLQRHTEDVRGGANGFSASNLAINGSNPFYSGGFDISSGVAGPSGNSGKEVKETKEVVPAENRWGAFLSGTGEWVNVSGTDNARGFDLVSGGFTLGVDYKVSPNFAVGLAAGYVGTTADLTDHGRVWVNGGKLGLYATTFAGGWYADVAAFGGYNSYSTRRSSIEGEARGDTDGGELNALFGTGYDFKARGFTFGPTATFNYTYVGINGFTEHDSLAPLDIHGADENSFRSAFGARVSYDCKCGGVIIRPELRAAWQHEYGRTSAALTSSFAGGAGDPFTTQGPQLGRDSALIGAGFAVQFNDRVVTYLYYDGQLGRENFESNAVMGGVRVTF